MLKFRFEGDLTHRVPEAGLEEGGPGGILGKAGEIVAWGKKPPVPSPPTSSPSGRGHTHTQIIVTTITNRIHKDSNLSQILDHMQFPEV